MKKDIIKWTLLGLFIRFLIMPFSFHGHDIFFINYFPFKFVNDGFWNPYLFLKNYFPQSLDNPYFPPGLFLTISAFLSIFKFILPKIAQLFSVFEAWNFTWQGNTIHFAKILLDYQLFRALFIFKLPYLAFDFAIGWILFQLLKSNRENAALAYKVWMINPFVLQSCYALGQVDIITAFFIMAAVYLIRSDNRYWAIVLLGFAAMTKIFPVILVPVAVLLTGRSFFEWVKLGLVFIISIVLLALPFYISSPDTLMQALFFTHGIIPPLRQFLFICTYAIIAAALFLLKRNVHPKMDLLIHAFISVLLLFYAFYAVTIRFFIIITPLLIYAAVKNRKFWIYNIIFFVTLFELRACGNSQQWGLFAALHPEFFSGLPIQDSYINIFLNVKYIHQLMYKIFVISSIVMVAHIAIINREGFPIKLRRFQGYDK